MGSGRVIGRPVVGSRSVTKHWRGGAGGKMPTQVCRIGCSASMIWLGPSGAPAGTTKLLSPSALVRVKARLQAGTVTDWSRQSWEIAQKQVYASVMNGQPCGPEPSHVAMDEATIEKEVPVARLQVERGGLRLAKLLDQALG